MGVGGRIGCGLCSGLLLGLLLCYGFSARSLFCLLLLDVFAVFAICADKILDVTSFTENKEVSYRLVQEVAVVRYD